MQVTDRSGKLVHSVPVQTGEGGNRTQAMQLEWNSEGDRLAILQRRSTFVSLWSAGTFEVDVLDTGLKDVVFVAWSHTDKVLAAVTQKGNLMLYNDWEKRKEKFMGKHNKRVSCGAWTAGGDLVLGSEDKRVTVSSRQGETRYQTQLKMEPQSIATYTPQGLRKGSADQDFYISVVVGGKRVVLIPKDYTNGVTTEFVCKPSYGAITAQVWVGESQLMLGFDSGQVIIIDVKTSESGDDQFEELFSKTALQFAVSGLDFCPVTKMAAICGAREIVQLSMGSFALTRVDQPAHRQRPAYVGVQWSSDGQILTAEDQSESEVIALLASLPDVYDCNGHSVAYLSNLHEITIVSQNPQTRTRDDKKIEIEKEPAFISLGETHAACGINNQCWFYRHSGGPTQVKKQDYIGAVEGVNINSKHAAVLSEGRIHFHELGEVEDYSDPGYGMAPEPLVIPERGQAAEVSCVALGQDFLVYGTRAGQINYWSIADQAMVNRYRHDDGGITGLSPNKVCTRVLFSDSRRQIFLFNPINDQLVEVPKCSGPLQRVLWDDVDQNVFAILQDQELHVYVYVSVSVDGPRVHYNGVTRVRPMEAVPVSITRGRLLYKLKDGSLDTFMLHTHKHIEGPPSREYGKEKLQTQFEAYMNLLQFGPAAKCAALLENNRLTEKLADSALRHLEVERAISFYRLAGNASMVLTLEQILNIEDKNLIAGHIVVLLDGDYAAAQELFMKSPYPRAALEMRKDMKQWKEALELAEDLAPEELPEICREYGGVLEMQGDPEARDFYQRALDYPERDTSQDRVCHAGIARATVQMGDSTRGKQLALDSNDPQLCRECAILLEEQHNFQEAAELYEEVKMYEKAVSLHMQTKSFGQAQALMKHVRAPKLHSQYARAKEVEGNYAEAAAAYEVANNVEAVVRINLQKLNNPQKAFALVRKTHAIESANLVAQFCKEKRDHPASIEFLLYAKRTEEAFDIAEANDAMGTFVKLLGGKAPAAEYLKAARFYESRGDHEQAGDLYHQCHQHSQALQLYLKCGDRCLDKCITVVGAANKDGLTNQLVDHLMGEADGANKDPNLLFKLHMALQNYEKAAQTAVLIAKQEQEMGNYKLAHSQLYDTYKELESQGKAPSSTLVRSLTLLHSYTLAKRLIRLGDHRGAARMLVRVARNISRFPSHVVQILTSTVVECQRAKLKKTAFEYASMLMRPEYRDQVAPAYKKKIELLVRKPDRDAMVEDEESVVPCVHCGAPGSESELQCHSCKNQVPFCVATGLRMVRAEWSQCPVCRFPCRLEPFLRTLELDKTCPMCSQEVAPGALELTNPDRILVKQTATR